jgi:chromosome partitioning protein
MTISIATQKGGTGKTTTSINLAKGLSHRGKRVLLVDMDSQANSSKVLLPEYQQIPKEATLYQTINLQSTYLPIHKANMENIFVSPSHILMSETDMELMTAKDHREERLKKALEAAKDDFDHIIIDCPPALGWLSLNAFTASDGLIIVVIPGYFELDSLVQLNKVLAEVREYFNPDLNLLGYLFNMSDNTVNSSTSLRILRQTYTDQVFKALLPRQTAVRDAHFERADIFTTQPDSAYAKSFNKFIDELSI